MDSEYRCVFYSGQNKKSTLVVYTDTKAILVRMIKALPRILILFSFSFILFSIIFLVHHVESGSLVLAASSVLGDANGDGVVDEGDYALWFSHYSTVVTDGRASGDFNGDFVVDGVDYAIWLEDFGTRIVATPTVIPSNTPTLRPTVTPVASTPTRQASPTVPHVATPTRVPSPGSSSAAGLTCATSVTLEGLVSCIVGHFGSFVVPSSSNQSDWKVLVTAMLHGQCDFAAPGSLLGIYQVKTFTDTDDAKQYCVAMEVQDTGQADGKVDYGWGTFIVNNAPSREINHSAPHAVSDATTQDEAVALFKRTNSRSFLMSGAKRDIGTSACQNNLGYQASDAAHNADSFFTDATEAIDAWYGARTWWQIQWHGMATSICPNVNVFLSHGFGTPPPADAKTVALKRNVLKYHPTWVTTVPGDSPSCSFIASENVSGRFLNGVPRENACGTAASQYHYKFIHIEQQPGYRSVSDWYQAVVDTFP